jgi:hypothetical protein
MIRRTRTMFYPAGNFITVSGSGGLIFQPDKTPTHRSSASTTGNARRLLSLINLIASLTEESCGTEMAVLSIRSATFGVTSLTNSGAGMPNLSSTKSMRSLVLPARTATTSAIPSLRLNSAYAIAVATTTPVASCAIQVEYFAPKGQKVSARTGSGKRSARRPALEGTQSGWWVPGLRIRFERSQLPARKRCPGGALALRPG